MQQYLDLLQQILEQGNVKGDRTGTGTLSLFGTSMRMNLQEGFPLLTTKRVFFKGVVHELIWFLKGDTNIKYLQDNGVTIWDEWADENGDLGPVYGSQWRKWRGKVTDAKVNLTHGNLEKLHGTVNLEYEYIDQINNLITEIKTNPNSRRLLVSAWNPALLPNPSIKPSDNVKYDKQALPPCHYSFQCYVHDNKLSLMFNIRSNDFFLGNPFNIASYALLCHMIAHVCNLEVGDLICNGGDTHLYLNHIEQAKIQLARTPRELPKLKIINKRERLEDFIFEDFELLGYDPYPAIKADISV
jgi:thymidylate synthase